MNEMKSGVNKKVKKEQREQERWEVKYGPVSLFLPRTFGSVPSRILPHTHFTSCSIRVCCGSLPYNPKVKK